MQAAESTTVQHLRLKRSRLEPTTARLRLSYLLSSVSLEPPSMAPAAILIVRSLRDPLPGRITKVLAPGALATPDWERAAQQSLDGMYRRAARPMWGAVPANAEAVLFADHAELLACLARDLASGASLAWWWQSIFPRLGTPLPGSWASVWEEEPSFLPAALDYLDVRHQAVAVLNRIAPLQAWKLLERVVRAFHLPGSMLLPHEAPALPRQRSAPGAAAGAPPAGNQEHGSAFAAALGASDPGFPPLEATPGREPGSATPPWEPCVARSSAPAEIGYQRQALLGVGLLLHRAPHIAFTPEFTVSLQRWIRAGQSACAAMPPDSPPPPAPQVFERRRDSPMREARPENRADRLTASASAATPAASELPHARAAQTAALRGNRPSAGASERGGSDPAPSASSRAGLPAAWSRSGERANTPNSFDVPPPPGRPMAAAAQTAPVRTAPIPPPLWECGEPTRLGGVLYLIHLLRDAELWRFRVGLGGWELIELLARCLLEGTPGLENDAVWLALAELAGRDPLTPAGTGFRPLPTYTAPQSWLDKSGDARFARYRSRGVEIWSAEDFLLVDSEEIPAQSGARCTPRRGRRGRRRSSVRPVGLSVSPQLRRFLHFVLPYVRWRLERALGASPVAEVLLRSGRLYVTATHVDMVMSMQQISIPARLAGLDANPGWVPWLGRVVKFHFGQGS